MLAFSFVFSSTWWLILPALLAAAGYAYFMYPTVFKEPLWFQRGLAALRFLTVFFLAMLLINPSIKTVSRTTEKPVIVLAQDNSASLLLSKFGKTYSGTYAASLQQLKKALGDDYAVKSYTFGDQLKENGLLDFREQQTDLSGMFESVENAYVNQNVGALIVASDGIPTKGSDPLYAIKGLKFPIYTIAMGDTTPQKDVLVAAVEHNKLVYYKNDFRMIVAVAAQGFAGKQVQLTVKDGKGAVVLNREIRINEGNFRLEVPLDLHANTLGFQRYTIRISNLVGEITKANNERTVFVEVVDGKQKVLLVANAPHPDLSAIKQSIEANENNELSIRYAADVNPNQLSEYDLVILHQLPSTQYPVATLVNILKKQGIPLWFIIGGQTYLDLFNNLQLGLTISGNRQSSNEVQAAVSANFFSFGLSPATTDILNHLPPVAAPFGNYGLAGDYATALYQRVGSVATSYPLLTMGERPEGKIAFLCAEGWWKWRLANYAETKDHQAIDELMNKTVQYLITKEDRRKFRVKLDKNQFTEQEHLLWYGELYNDNYELINTPDVVLNIKNEQGKTYPFSFNKTEKSYQLDAGTLPAGNYSYVASTKLGEQSYRIEGSFVVQQQHAEELQTRADHALLYAISKSSGGEMLMPEKMQDLVQLIKQNELIKTVSYEQRRLRDLIHVQWIFAFILSFLALEWFLRKRSGTY